MKKSYGRICINKEKFFWISCIALKHSMQQKRLWHFGMVGESCDRINMWSEVYAQEKYCGLIGCTAVDRTLP